MAPPAKRQKRGMPTVADDEDVPVESPSTTTTTTNKNVIRQTRASTSNHPHNAAPIQLPRNGRARTSSKSVSASPEKLRAKSSPEGKGKSGNLVAMFSNQMRKQQLESRQGHTVRKQSTLLESTRPVSVTQSNLSDDEIEEYSMHMSSLVGLADRKRARSIGRIEVDDLDVRPSSQKFLRKPKVPIAPASQDETRPWAERFAPASLNELAVHKRKVADVRAWLEDVFENRTRQRLLILKGGAGTGKTTTVQLLARYLGCEILEWRNPVGSIATPDGVQSAAAQFEDYLMCGGRFTQLALSTTEQSVSTQTSTKPLDRRKQVLLVEEFPNTFSRHSTALQSFRSSVLLYLAKSVPRLAYSSDQNHIVAPVIMAISETLLTTASAAADSFTAHRLLGPELLSHPGVRTIEFNSIAPTLLAKALELVVQKEARKSGRRKTPGPLVLKKLGEIGDIRSATGSLEFLCLRGDSDGDWGSRVAFGNSKRGKEPAKLTAMEVESLEMVTRREATLGIFHAVGKVVYNKRDDITEPSSLALRQRESLPEHMAQFSRPKASQVCVDSLLDEMGTDIQTFVAALHENYLLSCEAAVMSQSSTLDHVVGCLETISDSDILSPSWDRFSGHSGSGTASDVLRQEELGFQVAVRGLLFALPCPVRRQLPPKSAKSTSRSDPHKMFFPNSLRMWRAKEIISSSIDLWVTRILRAVETPSLHSTNARPTSGIVESWRQPRGLHTRSSADDQSASSTTPLLGASAKQEILLERLPYMTLLARTRCQAGVLRDLEGITAFRGNKDLHQNSDTPFDDEANDNEHDQLVDETMGTTEPWSTDRPGDEKDVQKRNLVLQRRAQDALSLQHSVEQKLVLSDDDIEDF